jgi:dTDP-4-dehydrorhamnose reductase
MEDACSRLPTYRIFISGGDCLAGANLASRLAQRADVHALFERGGGESSVYTAIPWEPKRRADVLDLVRRVRPRWIVHCGLTSLSSWDRSPDREAWDRERQRVAWLAEAAGRCEARLVVIATDRIFAGPRLFHEEESSSRTGGPTAIAVQKIEKALAEHDALVVRTHVFGWSHAGAEPCFAEQVWQSLAEGRRVTADPHACATPILAADLADRLWLAMRRGLRGILHIAGAERVSQYQFARGVAAAFGFPFDVDAVDGATAACETSLDTRRARHALGCPMPLVREGLDRFAMTRPGSVLV